MSKEKINTGCRQGLGEETGMALAEVTPTSSCFRGLGEYDEASRRMSLPPPSIQFLNFSCDANSGRSFALKKRWSMADAPMDCYDFFTRESDTVGMSMSPIANPKPLSSCTNFFTTGSARNADINGYEPTQVTSITDEPLDDSSDIVDALLDEDKRWTDEADPLDEFDMFIDKMMVPLP
jgi:hypothetical protein